MAHLDKGGSYHTPLLLRLGFLHSYKITMGIATLEFLISAYCETMAGVVVNALLDPWTYIWFPLWFFGTYIVRQIVSGFDNLFDIFDEEFESRVKLYASFDVPPTNVQRRIQSLFVSESKYNEFRESIRRLLFSRWERVLLFLYALANPAIVFIVVTVYDPAHTIGYYGSFVEPYVSFLTYWNLGFALFLGYFLVSALWVVIVMILSISKIDNFHSDLKVTEYAEVIREAQPPEKERVMGYDTFYAYTTPIGQFLYSVTFRIMIFIVSLVVYMFIVNFLIGFDIGLYGYLFSMGCVAITLILFISPQIGLHNILAKTKNELRDALVTRRDKMNTEVLWWVSKCDEVSTKEIVDNAYINKTALERIEQLIQNIDDGATWSFRMPTALKLIATSLTPLLVTLAQFILHQYAILP